MTHTKKPGIGSYLAVFVALISIIAGCSWYFNTHPQPKPTIETKIEQVIEYRLPNNLLLYLTIEDLEADLIKNYPYISATQRRIILDAIVSTSKVYKVDPLILYAICAVESSFRWWLVHDKIKVLNYQNKPVETHAIGIGGIVYEIWEPKLKEANILQTRSDLYDPAVNIKAIGLIYSELYKLPLKDKAYHPAQSALIRYFGGNYQVYFKRIDDVIVQLFREKFYSETK